MHILQLCNKPPYPTRDGGTMAALDITKGLSWQGHQVDILTMSTPKHPSPKGKLPDSLSLVNMEDRFVDTTATITGYLRNLLFSRTPYIAERFISKEFQDRLIEKLQKNKYDVVHLEGLYLSHYVSVIRRHSKALISYRAHNIEHHIWEALVNNEKNYFRKILLSHMTGRLKKYELKFLNKYDLLVPITQKDSNFLDSHGNYKNSHICQTGIESERVSAITCQKQMSIFYLGSLDWLPNIEGLTWFIDNVWPQLKHNFPNLEFHIAGRNSPQDFADQRFPNGIVFHGEVKSAETFLETYNIMLVPLFSASGMRIKIIEGLSKGKAIVTTTIGTEGINTKNGKTILVADTASEFQTAISKLLIDKELNSNIKSNALSFIKEQFNTISIGKKLSDFFEKNLNNRATTI